ncbi:MAG: RagB/SusD family nutrient uptake outer membrane protein [Bacteroidota bacterium]
MKKIIILVFFATLGFGCKKVLNTSPFSSITDATAFATSDRCLLSLNGIYDAAQSTVYVNGTTDKRGYPFGSANIEQGDMRGEDMVNVAAFFQVTYQGTYNSTSPNCVGLWKGLYILINDVNIGIAGFRQAGAGGIITPAVATQYEAECRFLRAMAHHEALIQWARPYLDGNGNQPGIPYRETAINTSDAVASILNTPRMRVDSVYAKILADLDFAETNLPNNIFTYRASKAAAIALKMRVKAHLGLWTTGTFMGASIPGVLEEGAKLVPATVNPLAPTSVVSQIGGWALTATPDGPFANNNSLESVFSIKNDASDAPSSNGALASMYGSASITPTPGRGLIIISPVIWNNAGWLCDDKRRSSSMVVSGTNNAGTQSYFTTKYRDYVNRGDYAPQIRFAEVLLTQAEAEARKATIVSARAVDLLNVVRNRSLATPATQQYTIASFATKNDLISAILLERRIEFLAEGKRWSDISRLAKDPDFSTGGIPAKAVNGNNGASGFATYVCGGGYTPGQAAIPYNDYRFVWPIPQSERDANPVIAQNPSY